jgi:ATP-dependent Clp protease ATP-binding subunit ClpA
MSEPVRVVFSDQSQWYAQWSYEIASQHRQSTIVVSHMFLALLDHPDETLLRIFDSLSLDTGRLKPETLVVVKLQVRELFFLGRKKKIFMTPLVKQSIEAAIALSKELSQPDMSPAHIFWGVISSVVKEHNIQSELQFRMRQIFSSHHVAPQAVLKALREVNNPPKEQQED